MKQGCLFETERPVEGMSFDVAVGMVRGYFRGARSGTTNDIFDHAQMVALADSMGRDIRAAISSVMLRCQRDGVCRPTSEHRKESNGVRHATGVRVWEAA